MKDRYQKMINYEYPEDDQLLVNEDDVRVFEGLKADELGQDQTLLEILELNAEQLAYYLEEFILSNPFIELEYSTNQHLPAFDRLEKSKNEVEQFPNLSQSLDSYLFEQIMLYRQTPIRDAMVDLVSQLDERGFLPYPIEELAKKINAPEIITLDAVTLIKQLEPAGIGAYDLQESLMIQTEQDDFAPNVAYYLLEVYFDELNEQDYTEIMKQTNLTEEEIMTCVNYYHTLRANPASLFDRYSRINLIPDVTVTMKDEGMELHYNRQYYPRVIFNQGYYNELQQRQDEMLDAYIEKQANDYYKLANNLRQREQLIMQVVRAIIVGQKDFFRQKTEKRISLSIKKIARMTRLSEPIIYRVIVNKNLEWKDNVFALSDFINLASSKDRNGITAHSIKERIHHIIDSSPVTLSDRDLVDRLAQDKIMISEKIVGNYRQSLGK